mmetsp:Transcript_24644/g.68722  ORF Transcript_24644/g.68722 Transcript_24644/m.68722 type:complete len:334 (-) Transcript_24644:1059-2060(-)
MFVLLLIITAFTLVQPHNHGSRSDDFGAAMTCAVHTVCPSANSPRYLRRNCWVLSRSGRMRWRSGRTKQSVRIGHVRVQLLEMFDAFPEHIATLRGRRDLGLEIRVCSERGLCRGLALRLAVVPTGAARDAVVANVPLEESIDRAHENSAAEDRNGNLLRGRHLDAVRPFKKREALRGGTLDAHIRRARKAAINDVGLVAVEQAAITHGRQHQNHVAKTCHQGRHVRDGTHCVLSPAANALQDVDDDVEADDADAHPKEGPKLGDFELLVEACAKEHAIQGDQRAVHAKAHRARSLHQGTEVSYGAHEGAVREDDREDRDQVVDAYPDIRVAD